MKNERRNVGYPLWRKKVDKSLLAGFETPIPEWMVETWALENDANPLSSKQGASSLVCIRFKGSEYEGHLLRVKNGRCRLRYEEALGLELQRAFLMSHMRSLEGDLSKGETEDVEQRIPFWEFLDIEFDASSRQFFFEAYYKQAPTFPALFSRLITSPVLKGVNQEFNGSKSVKVFNLDWRPRDELRFEVGAMNVIYMLADTNKGLLYIGETKDLIRRLNAGHPIISDWDLYRYDVLPPEMESYRLAVERMVIRQFAAVLANKKGVESLGNQCYALVNEKVDK